MDGNCLEVIPDASGQLLNTAISQPLIQTPPLLQCEACVVLPVRDEAEHLDAVLTALAHQVDRHMRSLDPARYEVILFANNCTDDSAAIARRFARRHPDFVLHVAERTLPAAEAYIGRVRQLLMDEAYRRLLLLGRKRGIIASTDGDTIVDLNWLAATLDEVANGADAVGGRIVITPRDRQSLDPYTRACYLRSVGYQYLIAELETYLDPDAFDSAPRHHQHQGASLAVTAEMYALAGGMPAVRTPEDIAFYRALKRVGARFRHSLQVRATTSARQTGRTPMGMANQLAEWSAKGQKHSLMVEPAAAIETRLRTRFNLKTLWYRSLRGYQPSISDVVPFARTLGITADWLAHQLTQPQSFNLLFEYIEQRQQQEERWRRRWSLVTIEEAIATLRLRLDQLRPRF
jgi:hypothetical protein